MLAAPDARLGDTTMGLTDGPGPFGVLLQQYRVAAGWSQEELADRAGLSRRGISDLERGQRREPHPSTVRRLAEALRLGDIERGGLLMAAQPRRSPVATTPRQESDFSHANAVSSPSWPLIGREAELGFLLSSLERVAAAGRGHLVFLVGEPGIGKTRVARELLSRARAAGFGALVGGCFEQYAGLPFFPLVELLTQAWQTAPDRVREVAFKRWAELGHFVPDVLRPPALSGDDDQLRIFRAVTGFLRELASERPLVLFLDDVQWADSATIDLLLYLVRHVSDSRTLVLASCRDAEPGAYDGLDELRGELVRERLLDEVSLGRLTPDITGVLIRSRFDTRVASDEFVNLVHARTEGNPFFIEEVLKSLVEEGTLFLADGGWQWRTVDEIRVPRSVRLVVAQRVGAWPDVRLGRAPGRHGGDGGADPGPP